MPANWIVNNLGTDFPRALDLEVIDYIRPRYSLVYPVLAPAVYLPTDKAEKLFLSTQEYGSENFYVLVRAGRSRQEPHKERKKLFTFHTPVFVRIYVKNLSMDENFPWLDNIQNELNAIINQYRGHPEIPGIDTMYVVDDLDPLEPGEGEGTTGFDNVWSRGFIAELNYWKQDISAP